MEDKITLKISKRDVTWLLGLYIISALYLLYFSPFCGRAVPHRSLQPVPFKTIREQMTIPHGADAFLGNMAGNVIVLLPVGFFLALLGWKARLLRAILFFFVLAFLVELFQYLFWVGCMDVDDIWMNGAGGLLGFVLGRRIQE